MDPDKEHQLSEEEINKYSEELDELYQSLIPLLIKGSEDDQKED